MAQPWKSRKFVATGNSILHSYSHEIHSDTHSIRHKGGCWGPGAGFWDKTIPKHDTNTEKNVVDSYKQSSEIRYFYSGVKINILKKIVKIFFYKSSLQTLSIFFIFHLDLKIFIYTKLYLKNKIINTCILKFKYMKRKCYFYVETYHGSFLMK